MPTSVSCQRTFVPSTISGRNVSAPGGAHWRFGAATAIQICPKIKNPASSAGHVRPFVMAAFYPRSLPDVYARSSFFWFPVFVTNPTSACDSRPGQSGESPTHYGATDIRRVYLIFRFRQVFAAYFCSLYCGFHHPLWKSLATP
jgi:hypothetical protein